MCNGIESLPQTQPNVVDLRFFKLFISFDQIFEISIVYTDKGIIKFEFVAKTPTV